MAVEGKNRSLIYLLLVAVVLFWGVNVVMMKYLTRFYPPLALAPIRLGLATCVLIPAVFSRYGFVIPSREALLPVCGAALFSVFLHHATLAAGVAVTSGSHAALILGLNPLATSLLAGFVREKLSTMKMLGIVLGFSGVLLIASGKSQGTASLYGDIIMFSSMFVVSVGYLFIKKSTVYLPTLVVTAYTHILGTAGLIVLGLCENSVWVYEGAGNLQPVAVLLFSSFINTALGAVLWNTGIKQVGASITSMFSNGIPVAGVLASAFFLHEQLTLSHFAALFLVVAGVSAGTGIVDFEFLKRKGQE
ncbi:MAG: DMT family transporter [Pelosinus sp.]|nr:DMT family transporter [Pelosinus sp.]